MWASANRHEIDDALRAANAVDEVAGRAAAHERERQETEPIAGARRAHHRAEDDQGDDGEPEEDPTRILTYVEAERGALIVHEAQLHDVADHGERQAPSQQ